MFLSVALNSAFSLNIPPASNPSEIDDDYDEIRRNNLFSLRFKRYASKNMDRFDTLNDDNNYPEDTYSLRHFKDRKPLLSFGKRGHRVFVPSTYKDFIKETAQKKNVVA